MAERLLGFKVIELPAVDSTNDHLRELFLEGAPEGTTVVARRQHQGRGRHGRAWASPPGGLYFSTLLLVPENLSSLIVLLAGIAPVRALIPLGLRASLKWPNDIMVGDRKLGGILGEGIHGPQGYGLILGFGLNTDVAMDDLPSQVQGGATSARVELGHRVENQDIFDRTLDEMDAVYGALRRGDREGLLREYQLLCRTLGRALEAQTPQGKIRGLAVGLEPDGRLIVEDDDGEAHAIVDATIRELG